MRCLLCLLYLVCAPMPSKASYSTAGFEDSWEGWTISGQIGRPIYDDDDYDDDLIDGWVDRLCKGDGFVKDPAGAPEGNCYARLRGTQSITRDFPLVGPGCVSFYFAWNEEDFLPFNDFMRVSYVDENGDYSTLLTLNVASGDKRSWQKVVFDIPDEAVGSVLKFEGLVENDEDRGYDSFLYLDDIIVSQGSCSPSTSQSTSPSSAPTFESVSHEVCGDFAVHARTTVTFDGVTSTVHNGDVGVYPGTSITGSHQFENGGDIVLNSSAFADHVVDSHASAMEGNYGTSETAMEIEIGGMTFLPGIYRSDSAINFAHSTVVTLDGNNKANPEFIFIAGSTLVTAADTYFDLKNGAKAENVVWVLGTAATLGARSHVAGSIMAGTAITFGTNSKLYGCALAQTAVTFESGGSVAIDHYEDDALITV